MAKGKTRKASKTTARGGAKPANALVADIVAAALVGAAAALKDAKKARQLAADAGDELETLARQGAKRGNAMWQLALDIGRRSLESLTGDDKPATPKRASKSRKAAPKTKSRTKAKPASRAKPAAKAKPSAKAKPASRTRAAPKARKRTAKTRARS